MRCAERSWAKCLTPIVVESGRYLRSILRAAVAVRRPPRAGACTDLAQPGETARANVEWKTAEGGATWIGRNGRQLDCRAATQPRTSRGNSMATVGRSSARRAGLEPGRGGKPHALPAPHCF